MRAAKTVEIGFVKTVARGIRPLTLAGCPDGRPYALSGFTRPEI